LHKDAPISRPIHQTGIIRSHRSSSDFTTITPELMFSVHTHGAKERVALLLWLRLNYCLILSGIFYHEACALGPRRRLAVWRDRPRFCTEPTARGASSEGNGGPGAAHQKK
jgi:hypothetical protein